MLEFPPLPHRPSVLTGGDLRPAQASYPCQDTSSSCPSSEGVDTTAATEPGAGLCSLFAHERHLLTPAFPGAGLPVPGVRRDSWHQAVPRRLPAVMSSHWLALTASAAAKMGEKKLGVTASLLCSQARPPSLLPPACGQRRGAFGGLGMCFREGLRSAAGLLLSMFPLCAWVCLQVRLDMCFHMLLYLRAW